MKKQIALKDVTLYWANLRQRNDMSGKYQVDLCNLNEKQKEPHSTPYSKAVEQSSPSSGVLRYTKN